MNVLKYVRKEILHYTMEELSNVLGVSKQSIYVWESGKKSIPDKRITQLSDLSGVPREFFVRDNCLEQDILNCFDKNRNTLKQWYLMCGYTQEYAVVFALTKEQAFEKLKNKRRIETNDMSMWEIEELTPISYDGVLYFY